MNKLKRKKRLGFTLIELLVVVAILALLSAIITVGYANAKAKSRDSKRISDVKAIAAAVNLYGEKYGNYKMDDAGYKDIHGWGYFNCKTSLGSQWPLCSTYLGISIGEKLVSEGFLSHEPVDPSGDITVTSAAGSPRTGHPYMFYPYNNLPCDCDSNTTVPICEVNNYNYFYVYAKLENTSGIQSSINASPDGYCVLPSTQAKTLYGMNYAAN